MTQPGFNNTAFEEFVDGAAAAFTCCALLNWTEEQDDPEINRAYHLGPEDFNSGNAPASAVALAGCLWARIEALSAKQCGDCPGGLYALMAAIAQANGVDWASEFDVTSFAWYAAMESLGHGVGIADYFKIPDNIIAIPYMDGDDAVDGEIAFAIYRGDC